MLADIWQTYGRLLADIQAALAAAAIAEGLTRLMLRLARAR